MGLDAQSNDPPAASSEEKSDVLSDTRAEAPDWDALTIELRCPRCGHDVRRLPQPRCPECGLQFSWGELIAAVEQRLSSPLFEYQWRYRPVRSFFGTLGRALLPWTLWTGARAGESHLVRARVLTKRRRMPVWEKGGSRPPALLKGSGTSAGPHVRLQCSRAVAREAHFTSTPVAQVLGSTFQPSSSSAVRCWLPRCVSFTL